MVELRGACCSVLTIIYRLSKAGIEQHMKDHTHIHRPCVGVAKFEIWTVQSDKGVLVKSLGFMKGGTPMSQIPTDLMQHDGRPP